MGQLGWGILCELEHLVGAAFFGWHIMAARAFGAYYIFGMPNMTINEVRLCGITMPTMERGKTSLDVCCGGIG
jgi:hypothetical protein